jgi:toxin HigB-1
VSAAGITSLAEVGAGSLQPDKDQPIHFGWPTRSAPPITLRVINAARYTGQVLRSFADKDTERVWRRERSRRFDATTQRAALRKLLILDAAETLNDVKIPPGNRLEKLRGDRAGQHSIRVNQQRRICFRWTPAGPEDVQIVDYH